MSRKQSEEIKALRMELQSTKISLDVSRQLSAEFRKALIEATAELLAARAELAERSGTR